MNPVDPPGAAPPAYSLPVSLRDWLRIVEIDDVEPYAGELFRYRFGSPPPDFPRHFVVRYTSGQREITVGYVHYTRFEDAYLGGGLCIDDRAYRRLSREHRDALRAAGGIAEQLLRHTLAELAHANAIFAYVGDIRSERVNFRVGFVRTGETHLIVYWPRPLADAQQRALIQKVAALGPF